MHNGHRKRVRERFLKEGLDTFEPHQILEFLLFYAIPRADTNEIAHQLMDTFGSLSAVLDAPVGELMKVSGIGETAACLLKSIPELARQYQSDKTRFEQGICSVEEAGAFLLPRYVGRTEEVFSAILLDNKAKVLQWCVISQGTVNSAQANLRKLTEAVIRYNATSIIIAHNHPAGIAIPSVADCTTTMEIVRAMKNIGVVVSDHIVIAENDFVSFRDSKQLVRYLQLA